MKKVDKKNIHENAENEGMQEDEREEKLQVASILLTRSSSIEFIEEFSGLTWEEISASLKPEEIKRFYENRITEEEEEEALAGWEKWRNYQLRLKPERDFMNSMKYAQEKGYVKGFVTEYTKGFPQAEQDKAKMMAAKELMREGVSIELIEKYTGLTGEEIQEGEFE